MAMEEPPVRVERREIRAVVAGRLVSSMEEGERRMMRRWEGPVTEVGWSGRARSCVSRVVSAEGLETWRAMDYGGALTPKSKAGT